MENTGLKTSLPAPLFSMPSSLVITVSPEPSLPAAAMVAVPLQEALLLLACPRRNPRSRRYIFTPAAIALAESIALPPPNASMKSTFSCRHSSIPSYTSPLLGFGITPPSSTYSTPSLFKDFFYPVKQAQILQQIPCRNG